MSAAISEIRQTVQPAFQLLHARLIHRSGYLFLILRFHIAEKIRQHPHGEKLDDDPQRHLPVVFHLALLDDGRVLIFFHAALHPAEKIVFVVLAGIHSVAEMSEGAVLLRYVIGQLRPQIHLYVLDHLKDQRAQTAVKFVDALEPKKGDPLKGPVLLHKRQKIGGEPVIIYLFEKGNAIADLIVINDEALLSDELDLLLICQEIIDMKIILRY